MTQLTRNDLPEMATKLRAHTPVYGTLPTNRLLNIMDNKEAYFYHFQEDTWEYYICLVKKETNWKLQHIMPLGTSYSPKTTLRTSWTQLRVLLDELGITHFYGVPSLEYGDPKLNSYFTLMPQFTWETVSVKNLPGGKLYTWYRDPDRRNEDELWKGLE